MMLLPSMTGALRSLLTGPLLAAACAVTALADNLPVPSGDVVLSVTGDISRENTDGAARFDLAMLEALESVTFETTTIWTEGVQSFTGVPLEALLESVGATGSGMRAVALNDYAVEIPVSDAVEGGPIVAYLQNGAPMSVREKGPLWVVYPYDGDAAYRTEQVYARSIWQLVSIEVLP